MGYDDEDDNEFDYDEFIEREFGTPLRSRSVPLHWQIVAIGLVAIFVLALTFPWWIPF